MVHRESDDLFGIIRPDNLTDRTKADWEKGQKVLG